MTHRSRRALRFAMAVLTAIAPHVAHAQRSETKTPASELPVPDDDDKVFSCKQRPGDVAITFKAETKIEDLITWAMGFTCRNFVYEPHIVTAGKRVMIIAPNKMSSGDAYKMFLVALSTMNLTVVRKGNVYRIVDVGTARTDTVPIVRDGMPDNTEQLTRYIYKPTYVTSESLLQPLTGLKSANAGDVAVVGQLLILTDYGSKLRDMIAIARLIDVPNGSDAIYTIPVLHADATKLHDKVNQLLGMSPTIGKSGAPAAAASPSAPARILVEERTNTLIVAGSEAAYLRAKALVERLDIALEVEGGAAFHVYRLGNAISDDLAKTLNEAITGAQKPSGTTKPATPSPASPGSDLGSAIEGPMRVISDKPTNALIVVSSGRDFLAIKDVIRELDQPRRQVFIETMILEIEVGDSLDIGSSSHGGLPFGDSALLVGGVQTSGLRSLGTLEQPGPGSSLISSSGLIGGLISEGTKTLMGVSIPSYSVLFQALAGSSNANLLSAPSIITLDNKEAKYKVGTSIPFKRGDSTFPTGATTTNIDRRDLLLELTLTPHITADDKVLLDIKQAKEDLASESTLGPIWSTRGIETSVLVRDQQSVVIGGLIQEKEISTSNKVPLLGDIPLLGYLFKYSTRSKRKTNLVVMLTPYIIHDQVDLQQIRERKLREHTELARSFKSLDAMAYEPKIDYGRKRGLLEEINRSVESVEQDIAARAALRAPERVEHGPVVPAR